MKMFIFSIGLFFTSMSWAVPGTVADLEKAPEVEARLQQLTQEGWKKTGISTMVSIDRYYYGSSSQGETLLLVIPIYGSRYLSTSCLAATFVRGGFPNYHFKEFILLGGYCQ